MLRAYIEVEIFCP